ncbi:MAG: hypothetical protein MAG795_00325 [Candidatus Woesearchaeota archaeon]|nr:hypothetical protein [Candidatus Woesearchaeota archaeon]
MKHLFSILLVTLVTVLEILVLINNTILTPELVIISLFLVMLFVMLFVVGKKGFWKLNFLANAAHLLNLFYLIIVFGASLLTGIGVLISLFGMLLCLSKSEPRPVKEVKVMKRKPEINKEIDDLHLDEPEVVVEYPKNRFVASQNSEIYHRLECMWADNIHKENKVFFDSKKQARKAGLRKHECVNRPPEDEQVPEGDYVASPYTEVYHKDGCEWADNIKNKNKIYFQSKTSAENAGYRPHSCLPGVRDVKKTYSPGKFIASKNSALYHDPKCEWAGKIHKKNRVWFNSGREARKQGHRKHRCK